MDSLCQCQGCKRLPDFENLTQLHFTIWPSLKHLQVSAQNGCALCQLFLAIECSGKAATLEDISLTARSKLPVGTICLRCQPSNPNPWSILEVQEGSSNLIGQALAFTPGTLDMFPISIPVNFRIGLSEGFQDIEPLLFHMAKPANPENSHSTYKHDLVDVSTRVKSKFVEWIENCENKHKECRLTAQKPFLPRRLVRISQRDTDPRNLHLIGTLFSTTGSEEIQYLALSYRWPVPSATEDISVISTLTKSTLPSLTLGVSSDKLLPLYRSTLQVTQLLGYEYVWIDALCIMQDSIDEWAMESQRLSKIYEVADCTLSLDEPSATGGFPLERTRVPVVELQWPNDKKLWVVPKPEYYETAIGRSALSTRGWVHQERIFSRRILHFTQRELFWSCFDRASESGTACRLGQIYHEKSHADPRIASKTVRNSSRLPLPRTSHEHLYENLYTEWKESVQSFSAKDLTYPSDRLVAMSSLAAAFSLKIPDDDYLAGIWSGGLNQALPWFTSVQVDAKRPVNVVDSAPSWSWASVNAPVEFFFSMELTLRLDEAPAYYLGCNVGFTSNNSFGSTAYAMLKIRGKVLQGTQTGPANMSWSSSKMQRSYDYAYARQVELTVPGQPDTTWTIGNLHYDTDYHPGNFYIILLTGNFALAIEHIDQEYELPTFRRIGIIDFGNNNTTGERLSEELESPGQPICETFYIFGTYIPNIDIYLV